MGEVRDVAERHGVRVALTGILPTLEKGDLSLDSMTPIPRYYQLNQVMRELRGGEFRTLIKGLDELQTTHDNVMRQGARAQCAQIDLLHEVVDLYVGLHGRTRQVDQEQPQPPFQARQAFPRGGNPLAVGVRSRAAVSGGRGSHGELKWAWRPSFGVSSMPSSSLLCYPQDSNRP